jgi:alpha/beta superfamily hydrolase
MEEPVRIPVGGITIDGRLVVPRDARGGAVVCHPHPQYGGDMENELVVRLTNALGDAGFATLRFDFRGVGASGGTHDKGRGEVEDVRAAATLLRERLRVPAVTLVGYSFGSLMAMQAAVLDADGVTGVVAIGPPVRVVSLEFLAGSRVPVAFVVGDRDQFCPAATLDAARARFAPASALAVIPGADHFFAAQLAPLATRVVELAAAFARNGQATANSGS